MIEVDAAFQIPLSFIVHESQVLQIFCQDEVTSLENISKEVEMKRL